MDDRTREYLAGRFRDHYRRNRPTPPPDAAEREWGFIPWTEGPGTTMVRHKSLMDLGDLGTFLEDKAPRHAYFSAGRYDQPGVRNMSQKGWRGTDLIFDLDADHLPGVDSNTSYEQMLEMGKEELKRLLDFLEGEFALEDITLVFSGGRGYHVHIRDEWVLELDGEQRAEITKFISGDISNPEILIEKEVVRGDYGRKTPAHKWSIRNNGGWGTRVGNRWTSLIDELYELEDDEAIERLAQFENIGAGTADKILARVDNRYEEMRNGNIEIGGGATRTLIKQLIDQESVDISSDETAAVDEPVTTDTHRLIRLPGSLHGGSGLAVRRIDREDLGAFDPLVDAVPETFVGQEIRVDVTGTPAPAPGDATEVRLRGNSFTIDEGTQFLPEYVGVFLMTRGRAEKAEES